MDCPFCDDENLSVRFIYKDHLVMAFPTNIPITPGHTLICPVRHASKVDELSDQEILAIKAFIVRLKKGLAKSLGAKGFNVAWNEGHTAGQAVDHLHIHIVPRKPGDTGIHEYEPRKFLYRPGSRSESPNGELQAVAELIKKSIE